MLFNSVLTFTIISNRLKRVAVTILFIADWTEEEMMLSRNEPLPLSAPVKEAR